MNRTVELLTQSDMQSFANQHDAFRSLGYDAIDELADLIKQHGLDIDTEFDAQLIVGDFVVHIYFDGEVVSYDDSDNQEIA